MIPRAMDFLSEKKFDSEKEREKLKVLKAEQAKQRLKKMRLYGAAMGQLSRKHLERSDFC